MHSKSLIFIVISCATLVKCLVLECEFKNHESHWGKDYTCFSKNLVVSETDRIVEKVIGTHKEGKTIDDVVNVYAEHQNCSVLPLNLGVFFKNLMILYFMKSNVKTLNVGDLDGLNKLVIFDVSHNPLTTIPKDFFKGHSHITKISFFECKLDNIEPGTFDHLENLNEGHFQYNPCIDIKALHKLRDQESALSILNRNIKKCDGKSKTDGKHIPHESNLSEDSFEMTSEEVELWFGNHVVKHTKDKDCEPRTVYIEKKCEPKEPKVITNTKFIEKCSETGNKSYQPELTFLQRHTYLINFILICIIAVLVVLNLMNTTKTSPFMFSFSSHRRSEELREDF